MLTEAAWIEGERRVVLAAAIQAVRWLAAHRAFPWRATRLPEPCHAARFLVAQARALAVPLLSADSRIQAYPHVQWLW